MQRLSILVAMHPVCLQSPDLIADANVLFKPATVSRLFAKVSFCKMYAADVAS